MWLDVKQPILHDCLPVFTCPGDANANTLTVIINMEVFKADSRPQRPNPLT